MATSLINAHLIIGDGRDFATGSVKIDQGAHRGSAQRRRAKRRG